MSEEKNIKLENTDPFGQKLKQMLSEELSDIQVSEELIQRTLQAAEKASPSEISKEIAQGEATREKVAQKGVWEAARENRMQKPKYRFHLFRGCAVAAALLVVLVLGLRSIKFSMKGDSAENTKPTAYEEGNFGGDGDYSGTYKGEPENSGSSQGVSGNEWVQDSMGMPQEVPTSYPGGWADDSLSNEASAMEGAGYDNDKTGEGCWDSEYGPDATSPANIAASSPEESIERELLISRAVEILLSDIDEIAGIVPLAGFTDAGEAEGAGAADKIQYTYREFYYAEDEEIEIIGRVYPDGRLEGKLTQHGQVTYKAAAGQPEMEQLWEILDAQVNNGGME